MKFSIIATSDVHGHTERFSQLAQMIQKRQPALLIDNGDFLQGSHLSYFYENHKHETHPQIELANTLGYDVAVFGNHEFNYSLEAIEQMRKACNFPWLAANIHNFTQGYFIKEVKGVRIAVIGVVTHYTALWDEGETTKYLQFEDALMSAKKTVQFVHDNEDVQLVILSYHGGFERDIHSGQQIDLTEGENQGYRMLTEIDGIDIFITGHQHLELSTNINGVSIVQPGSNANCFAQIDVTLENGQLTHEPCLVYVDSDLPQQTFPEFDAWKSEIIGYSNTALTYDDFFTPRIQATAYTQLLHDMQLYYSGAQLSVIELPYHAQGGFSTTITKKQVLHNMPRQNRLNVIELTGAEIRAALEQSAAVFAKNKTVAIDFSMNVLYPEPQPYIYDVWGGIDYEITLENPVGNRVTKLLYKGHSVQDDARFKVAINSYRATGVHQFPMFAKQPIFESEKFIPELMMDYIKQFSPLDIKICPTFQVK